MTTLEAHMRLFFLLLLGLTNLVNGQNADITVRVVDAMTMKPIKNANVVVSGTTKGTPTNVLGFCRVRVLTNEKQLVISHVSYETGIIEIPVNVSSFIVSLERGSFKLQDIDLTQYPNKFNPNDFKRMPERNLNLQDSMVVVEVYADFPYEGGLQFAFKEFFGNAFQFPIEELKANKSGTIDLEFTIDKTGDYSDVKCLTDSLSGACQELKRVLTVIPKWVPAKQYGEPVPQTFRLLVTYGPTKYWRRKLTD